MISDVLAASSFLYRSISSVEGGTWGAGISLLLSVDDDADADDADGKEDVVVEGADNDVRDVDTKPPGWDGFRRIKGILLLLVL